jgi:alkylation response protein AidB-like acyl-CoA dehydrogenase
MRETRTDNPLLDVARAFRPRILSERERVEASRRLPTELAKELARAGFIRMFVPEAYSGLDLTPMHATDYTLIDEFLTVARASSVNSIHRRRRCSLITSERFIVSPYMCRGC